MRMMQALSGLAAVLALTCAVPAWASLPVGTLSPGFSTQAAKAGKTALESFAEQLKLDRPERRSYLELMVHQLGASGLARENPGY